MSLADAAILAGLVVIAVAIAFPRKPKRYAHHSWRYWYFVDRNSLPWRFRRWQIWHTGRKRCERCGRRVTLHRKGFRHDLLGEPVMNLHHKNYRRVILARRRDLELLCDRCHMMHHAIRRGRLDS